MQSGQIDEFPADAVEDPLAALQVLEDRRIELAERIARRSTRDLERIAVQEASRLEIPVIAIIDSNCDPDNITYPIPGNDDAIRSIKLITSRIADACIEGAHLRTQRDEAEFQSSPAGEDKAATATLAAAPAS